MTTTSTVLILGAGGRLGAACVKAFAGAGWHVMAQTRKAAPAQWPAGVSALVTGDAPIEQSAAKLQSVDVVVHAMNPAYTNAAWTAQIPAMMTSAIEVAQALNATLMFPGNVYNFGANMPKRLDESTAQNPTTVKGKLRVDAELALREATERTGLRAIVIRAGDFFGSGKGAMFDQVSVSKIKMGIFTHSGLLDVATPWAFLPDLAQTFVAVAEKRQQLAKFEVLHFAGHNINGHDWLGALQPLAEANKWVAHGQALKTSALPWPVMRVIALFNPTLASVVEMRYLQSTPHALDNTRLRKKIGTEPHTPLNQAAASALADLGLTR
ncbi:MAG: sugar nucleotide-binding protein [Polaromonas sp.]